MASLDPSRLLLEIMEHLLNGRLLRECMWDNLGLTSDNGDEIRVYPALLLVLLMSALRKPPESSCAHMLI